MNSQKELSRSLQMESSRQWSILFLPWIKSNSLTREWNLMRILEKSLFKLQLKTMKKLMASNRNSSLLFMSLSV